MSSIAASDLDLSQTQAPGVRHLHAYLDFAQRGPMVMAMARDQASRDHESPLERDVAEAIREMGYDVEAQVGCSGYRIDLGVRAPSKPGHLILGVECDGASYHSSQTVRDRDRLRQEVLETLGWRIHRIWSPAWLHHRSAEIERLRQRLAFAEQALEEAESGHVQNCGGDQKGCVVSVEHSEDPLNPAEGTIPVWAEPYVTWAMRTGPRRWCEFHDPACLGDHAEAVAEIVAVEGPFHTDVIAGRLADAWDLQRVGSRMRNAAKRARDLMVVHGLARRSGAFLWPTAEEFQLRVGIPDPEKPNSARQLDEIATEEIALAMELICRDGSGIERDALISETARLFGIGRVGHLVRARIVEVLEQVTREGLLDDHGNSVTAT